MTNLKAYRERIDQAHPIERSEAVSCPTEIAPSMCDTCIFREGNLMGLRKGRLKSMVAECDRKDTNVVCHENGEQWCNGSVARRPGQMARVIQRLEGWK